MSKQSLILPILNPSELSKPRPYSEDQVWTNFFDVVRQSTWAGDVYIRKVYTPEMTFNRCVKATPVEPDYELNTMACVWSLFYNSAGSNLEYIRARRLLQPTLRNPTAFKQAFEERKYKKYPELQTELRRIREAVRGKAHIKLPAELRIEAIIDEAQAQIKKREEERQCMLSINP